MKPLIALALTLLPAHIAFAAFEHLQYGSRSAAMGDAMVAVGGNEWSAFINPALLPTVPERTLAVYYAPQPFELKELARGAATYLEPSPFGTFSLSASRFGFDLYRETRIGLSYGNDLAELVHAGVTLNYYSLSIRNYGSAATFGVDVGLLVGISESVHWGFTASNLNAPTIGAAREKLPQRFSTGIAYRPIYDGTLVAALVKDIRHPVELRLGVEYTFVDIVAVRAGTSSDPNTLNAGLGIAYAFARVDYAFSSHSELGPTHQFSLALTLGDL